MTFIQTYITKRLVPRRIWNPGDSHSAVRAWTPLHTSPATLSRILVICSRRCRHFEAFSTQENSNTAYNPAVWKPFRSPSFCTSGSSVIRTTSTTPTWWTLFPSCRGASSPASNTKNCRCNGSWFNILQIHTSQEIFQAKGGEWRSTFSSTPISSPIITVPPTIVTLPTVHPATIATKTFNTAEWA